jgi:two-component system response regulator PilR (NtrC family)/two-component system response regulator HydG
MNVPRELKILVVEDDRAMMDFLMEVLGDHGYKVTAAANGRDALEKLEDLSPHIIISDLKMPELDGISLLEQIKGRQGTTPFIILITAFGDVSEAIHLIDKGAYDYIIKPFKTDQLLISIKKATRELTMHWRIKELEEMNIERYQLQNLVSKNPSMIKILKFVEKITNSAGNVLLQGETGTGKEVLAKVIHFGSKRSDGPFVPVNCAALPDALLESELFGHVRGAFTDAKSDKTGLFVEAEGGTIFLDEITEMSTNLQAKLLRSLQERTIRPVGSNKEIPFDVRVIAATNKMLKDEIAEGRFREDLFFRLNVFGIEIPPLRERREDIPILIQEFLLPENTEGQTLEISSEVMRFFMNYSWPGNIRELENVIERCSFLTEDGVIRIHDLPEDMTAGQTGTGFKSDSNMTLEDLEDKYIRYIYDQCGQNKKKAAEILGVDRKTVLRRLKSSP